MEKQYPVFFDGKTVGEASMERKGMFWHIKCRCSITVADPLKIVAASGTHKLDLGAYLGNADGREVERWVSVKALPSDDLSFSLELQRQEQFIPLAETLPFAALEKLSYARFQTVAGQPGILISD